VGAETRHGETGDGQGEAAAVDEAGGGGAQQEGGEGQGDQYHMVIRLTQGDVSRTFKMQGWYASHHGHEFDGPFTEVSKKKKTITVWE
jgi:hypothetical protein